MNGTMRRLSVHPLSQEPHILHLLPNKPTRNTNLLTPDDNDLLSIQQFLRQNGGETAEHVMPGVDHHSFRADP